MPNNAYNLISRTNSNLAIDFDSEKEELLQQLRNRDKVLWTLLDERERIYQGNPSSPHRPVSAELEVQRLIQRERQHSLMKEQLAAKERVWLDLSAERGRVDEIGQLLKLRDRLQECVRTADNMRRGLEITDPNTKLLVCCWLFRAIGKHICDFSPAMLSVWLEIENEILGAVFREAIPYELDAIYTSFPTWRKIAVDLTSQLDESKKDLTKSKDLSQHSLNRMAKLQEELREAESINAKLNLELHEVRQKYTNIYSSQDRIKELEQELKRAREETEGVKNSVQHIYAKRADELQAQGQMEYKMKEAILETKKCNEEMVWLRKRINELEESTLKNNEPQQLRELQSELNLLRKQLDQKKLENRNLENELEEIRNKLRDTEAIMDQYKEELTRGSQKDNRMTKMIEHKTTLTDVMETRYKEEISKLNEQIQTLELKLQLKEEELLNQNRSSRSENERQKLIIEKLKKELNEEKHMHDEARMKSYEQSLKHQKAMLRAEEKMNYDERRIQDLLSQIDLFHKNQLEIMNGKKTSNNDSAEKKELEEKLQQQELYLQQILKALENDQNVSSQQLKDEINNYKKRELSLEQQIENLKKQMENMSGNEDIKKLQQQIESQTSQNNRLRGLLLKGLDILEGDSIVEYNLRAKYDPVLNNIPNTKIIDVWSSKTLTPAQQENSDVPMKMLDSCLNILMDMSTNSIPQDKYISALSGDAKDKTNAIIRGLNSLGLNSHNLDANMPSEALIYITLTILFQRISHPSIANILNIPKLTSNSTSETKKAVPLMTDSIEIWEERWTSALNHYRKWVSRFLYVNWECYDKNAVVLRKFLSPPPVTVEQLLQWAHDNMESGVDDEALRSLEEVLSRQPSANFLAEAHYLIGRIRHRQGKGEEALQSYSLAIQYAPMNPKFHRWKADLYQYVLNDLDEAINCYNTAIKLGQSDADAYNNRGELYRKLKDLTKAMEDFESAIQIKPTHVKAQNNLKTVRTELMNEQKKKAEEALKEALSKLPTISFDTNKYNLDSEDVASLNAVADIMKKYNLIRLRVVGETVNPNKIDLANNRSLACIGYLVNKGVDRTRLEALGRHAKQKATVFEPID